MPYWFEDFVLDPDRRELRRSGVIVPVEPQVFDLLAFLIGNRDRVVSKDDLLASVWSGRIVSESTLGTRINAARAAVADTGDAQRLIRTLPRKGFRFVGEVREQPASPLEQPAVRQPEAGQHFPVSSMPRHIGMLPHLKWLVPAALVVAVIVGVLLGFGLRPGGPGPSNPLRSVAKFDASTIPLLDSADRASLAGYSQKPEHKALAVSGFGWGLAFAAPDPETAKTEALQRCAVRPQTACTLYAVDMDVVWPAGVVPLPAPSDQRTEPLTSRFTADGLAAINKTWQPYAEKYTALHSHRALAASRRRIQWTGQRASVGEAVRLAVERCGYAGQLPCVVLAIDDFWTVEIPAAHATSGIFLPRTDAELPDKERQRVGSIYQGKPWRALAHGRNGTWHAIAGAPSEAAAIDAVMKSCGQADVDCRLFAVGNFRVADDK